MILLGTPVSSTSFALVTFLPRFRRLFAPSFLHHPTFQVREAGCLSSIRPVRAGVPQGAVLSPLLYSIFTADIPRSPQSHLAAYADDIALFACGRHLRYLHGKIQRHLDAVLSWAARWRLTVSAPKTQAILFSKRRILRDLPSLSLGDQALQYSPSVLYLGVVLDRHLTWAPHLARFKRNFLGKLAHVTPLLISSSLPLSTKLSSLLSIPSLFPCLLPLRGSVLRLRDLLLCRYCRTDASGLSAVTTGMFPLSKSMRT